MQSLAVKYRPTTFEDVVGQQSIIEILNRQIENQEYSNVYLFAGPSGTGKTTIARAFANKINKNVGSPIEIDAASNNGVDNIREIIKSAKERSLDSKYKIYIMDEAHMLTTQSWNALLKIIEEPPTYTIFMFATTDPQKIPATIQNRVMRFNLTRISSDKIKSRLIYICQQENFLNYEDTCDYISRISNNQMRDAIANLEKCAGYNIDLSLENCFTALGVYSYQIFSDLTNFIIDGNSERLVRLLNYVYNQGNDMKLFINQYLSFLLNVCKYSICKDINVTTFPVTFQSELLNLINVDNACKYYTYLIDKILILKNMLKNDVTAKDTVEVYLIHLCVGE